jgi:hypothetical protein
MTLDPIDASESMKICDLEYGCISTEELARFAADDPDALGAFARAEKGKAFADLVRKLVPRNLGGPGFYCWGQLSRERVWMPIYVGQTRDLERRVLESLKEERIAFWLETEDAEARKKELFEKGKNYYPRKWGEYQIHWERASKKAGTTHIISVKTDSLAHLRLELIEVELIQRWKPVGNTQNAGRVSQLRHLKPSAKAEINNYAEQVVEAFHAAIRHLGGISGDNQGQPLRAPHELRR